MKMNNKFVVLLPIYAIGTAISITVVSIITGVLLDKYWGINNLYLFYDITARLFLISMLLTIPFYALVFIAGKKQLINFGKRNKK